MMQEGHVGGIVDVRESPHLDVGVGVGIAHIAASSGRIGML